MVIKLTDAIKLLNEEFVNIFAKAIDHFGLTRDFRVAGYMLPDGTLLDFSGGAQGQRYQDHREIQDILQSSGTDAMIEFMKQGAIRLSPESGGIDLYKEPTDNQYRELLKYFEYFDGEVIVEINDGQFNKQYEMWTKPQRIVNEIRRFFQ